jgi:3-hydroxyisobutyrate dehydrogenase-like beta-hydroxyacid dehydrogenase
MAEQVQALRPAQLHDIPFSRPGTPAGHPPLQLGFLGLGAMGYLMARNLATHPSSHPAGSLPLIVWNRTATTAEKLVKELGEEKVRIAQSPAQMATDCDVIITNLANDDAVKYIYEQFSNAIKVHLMQLSPVGNAEVRV